MKNWCYRSLWFWPSPAQLRHLLRFRKTSASVPIRPMRHLNQKNSQGELVGFDIDLAKELCKRINTQCTFVENPLDALIPSLKAKKIDAIMSSLSITEKRQQEIAFTDKLYAADSRLVVAKIPTFSRQSNR